MPITSTSSRLFHCLRCRRQVMVCQQCDVGQRYCARGCRQHARKDSCKRDQRKYRDSLKGRMNNAQRQQRFRQRQREKAKIVTHQTSPSSSTNDLLTPKPVTDQKVVNKPKMENRNVCHFCGCHCGPFFRVGFLKKRTTYPYRSKKASGETPNGPE